MLSTQNGEARNWGPPTPHPQAAEAESVVLNAAVSAAGAPGAVRERSGPHRLTRATSTCRSPVSGAPGLAWARQMGAEDHVRKGLENVHVISQLP